MLSFRLYEACLLCGESMSKLEHDGRVIYLTVTNQSTEYDNSVDHNQRRLQGRL
jgi:hypothetical protein